MSLATALLTPILGDASPWTPRRLFQLGEAGGVYDPSDLTAEKVAWRRNLLTWSEDFTNAAWSKTPLGVALAPVVTANAGVAPDGTTTADRVVFDRVTVAAPNRSLLLQAFTARIGAPYTTTLYAKAFDGANVGRQIRINANFAGTSTLTLTADWQRVPLTDAAATTASGQIVIESVGAAQVVDVLLWGAQVEQSSTATAYQRITDFTSDFLAAFPTHGLYQDAAGTTPVTALGQPVGLVIDSKTGGLASAGPNLIAGGDFESGLIGSKTDDSGSVSTWTLNTTAPISGTQDGRLVITTGAGGRPILAFTATTVAGRLYEYAFDYKVNSGTAAILSINSGGALVSYNASLTGSGRFRTFITAAGTSNFGWLYFNNSLCNVQFDNISVREVPGVHAIQATNSSRPLLDGRVNLLTFSEQFDNAAWVKDSVTITANATVSPDGTSTADAVLETANTAAHSVVQVVALAAASYRISVSLKANGRGFALLRVTPGVGGDVVSVNLSTGTATSASGSPANIETAAEANGFWRVSFTHTAATAGSNNVFAYASADGVFANRSYLGDVTRGIFVWGFDVRLAADSAYPYQRVAAATDYADVGVPRSFAFDGFDDSLYTASNMDLSGTDKVTVLAGVRKLSDAAAGIVIENTATSATNPGAIAVFAPTSAATNFLWRSIGSPGGAGATDAQASFPAPTTRVLTGLGEIATDTCILRVDGAQVASSAGDQGTGNYANAVLFIGRRNNATLPFNGKAYQLIVRGALTDAATLAQAERYVGAKTGLYL